MLFRSGWTTDALNVIARVDCFSASGNFADSLFMLTATEGDLVGGTDYRSISAYRNSLYATDEWDPFPSGPSSFHFNGASQIDKSRNEFQPGRSTVFGKGIGNVVAGPRPSILLGPPMGFVIVSGYGWNFYWPETTSFGYEATNNRCAPGRVDFVGEDASFEVQCYTPSGYPVNASYVIGGAVVSAPLLT